jgi:DNA-binding CsgD family transcriptional regulator
MDAEVRLSDYQSVAQLKYIRDVVKLANANERNVLTNIGMLASSGINSHHVVRIVPMLLRKVMQIDIAAFCWSNATGDMIDAYAETPYFLSAEILQSSIRFQNQSKGNWPSFKENVMRGPCAGYILNFQNETFYNSEHYINHYSRINMRHLVDFVVHDGQRPYGAFLLMRSAEKGIFTSKDVELLKSVTSLLPNAFKTPIQIEVPTKRTYDLGIVMVDKQLKRKFCNLTAHQILWMMTRNSEIPMQFESDDDLDMLIQKNCKYGIKQAIKHQQFTETRNCYWGEFIVKYMYDAELGTVAINLQQMQPYPCHIAIKLSQESLSPSRLMITWLMLKGCVRKEIAKLLEIAEDTVAEHIQAIFKHFEVGSTVELVLKIYR